MKKPWYFSFIWLVCLPSDIIVWLATLVVWALWGTKLHWCNGLWCELKESSWPARTWYKPWGGTTFGHGGFYNDGLSGEKGIDTYIEFHENIHVEQYEAGMLRTFIIALAILIFTGNWILAGAIWISGGLLTFGPNWLTALLRGEPAYRGSHHEEAAYAQTELKARKDHDK